MIKHIQIVTTLCLGLLLACKPKSLEISEVIALEAQITSDYCQPNIELAEQAIVAHLNLLRELKRRSVAGYNYETAMNLAHGRLLLIYRHLGKTNEANEQFRICQNLSTELWKASGSKWQELNLDAYVRLLLRDESNLNVRWHTNMQATPPISEPQTPTNARGVP